MFDLLSNSNCRIKQRQLGKNGPMVSMIGLGCMGMSEFYGSANPDECRKTLNRALELGCNFFDTATIYGLGKNEEFLGEFFADIPRKSYVLATKCGVKREPENLMKRVIDNSAEHIEKSCEESLTRLKLDYIDLYYLHRIANNGEHIEDSMRTMAKLLKEEKIRYVGLSEASKETIERANEALLEFTDGKHQITAVQTEYSLMSRTPEIDGVIDACRELGIGFVPYAPLGRQYLTGANKTADSFEPEDVRRKFPRFQPENAENNQKIVRQIVVMAREKKCTPAQLCLAWVLAQGDNIVPIPGTKRTQYLEENLLAAAVKLTPEDLQRLDKIAPIGSFLGERYSLSLMRDNGFKTEKEIIDEFKKQN